MPKKSVKVKLTLTGEEAELLKAAIITEEVLLEKQIRKDNMMMPQYAALCKG